MPVATQGNGQRTARATAADLQSMKAADIMIEDVVTVSMDMDLRGVALLFAESKITGAPVVDSDGNLVGVISETDLVRYQAQNTQGGDDFAFFREFESEDLEAMEEGYHIEELPDVLVGDIMSTHLITAEEDVSLPELAKLMSKKRVHRLVIVQERRLSGIVTTMDILKAVAQLA